MRLAGYFLLLIGLAAHSFAASVSSSLQPEFASIGDRLQLEVRVDGASGKPVAFNVPQGDDFILLEIDSAGFARDRMLRFDFAVYDTGRFEFPGVQVIVGDGAAAETLLTAPELVQIHSVLSDTASALVPNKENWELEYSIIDEIKEQSQWVVPVLLLVLAAIGLWYWRKRRRAAEQGVEIPDIVLPAHELAVQELIALKDKKYPERGLLKEFYSEFSEILRRYIERRYGFPALEMTTYELEYKFDAPEFPEILEQRLLPALRESDLVKFAKFIPDPASCKQQLDLGFEVVSATREHELEEQPKEAVAA